YTVFTNEQLAQMVQARATSKAALEQVAGVGDARIEKYGERVLAILRQQWSGDGKDRDATGGSPVWAVRGPGEPAAGRAQGPAGQAVEAGCPGVRGAARGEPRVDARGDRERGDRPGRIPSVHDLRSQAAVDHGAVLPGARAAPRDHERLRARL